jgi:hypothetical protein
LKFSVLLSSVFESLDTSSTLLLFKYSVICTKCMCLSFQEAILSQHLNSVSIWSEKIFHC